MARRPRLARVIAIAAVFLLALFVLSPFSRDTRILRGPRRSIRFEPSSVDFATVRQHFPVSTLHRLPASRPKGSLPRVQHDFSHYVHDTKTRKRQAAVRDAFVRSWSSYRRYAWLRDELAPVTAGAKDTFGGWAATLVDSLDTLWIMGLRNEFHEAAMAAARLDWGNTTEGAINVFETTIRHLGGLLSAYDLSGERALLQKAEELGNMLYTAFDTPNRLPGFWLDFERARSGLQLAGSADPAASPCSLSLEFTRLAQLTGDNKFYDAISRITDFLERTQHESRLPGMWPKLINFKDEKVDAESGFTLGALSDSLYEYLAKMPALLGHGGLYEKMYRVAMDTVVNHLLFRPMLPEGSHGHDILFAGDTNVFLDRTERVSESQHLSCFIGGVFALGGKLFSIPDHITTGEQLARGCAWMYDAFPTGLMPEIFNLMACDTLEGPCPWDAERWQTHGDKRLKKGILNARDPRYILRPEAIESIFILYRITGNDDLRDVAWRMFESIMTATKTDHANSAIADVTAKGETVKMNSMEVGYHRIVFLLKADKSQSFWLAETLKYFYLIFSPPELISLDDFVFNTEAHPLQRPR